MVPLNPNELSRAAAVASPHRGSTSPGMRNDPDDAIDAKCTFSLRAIHLVSRASPFEHARVDRRSCALTASTPASRGPATSDARPAAAAAASRWPRFDLSDAHSSGPPARAREAAPT